MQPEVASPQTSAAKHEAPESDLEVHWSLVRPVRRILNRKRILFISTAAGLFLGVLLVLIWKPYYTAAAVFLPPKPDASSSGGANLVFFGADETSDTYLGMLGSRTVADQLIDKLGLVSQFHAPDKDTARNILASSSRFTVNKNTLISVQVSAGTGELAAEIANAYLDALYDLNAQMVTSASAHRRMFFDQQLQDQKMALSQAEVDLKATQERTGIVLPVGEAEAGIAATAQLQSQINTAETKLAGLRVAATDQNPEVMQLQTQIDQLRSQLAHQQANSVTQGSRAGLTPQGRLPEFTLEYQQKQHEVQLRQAVYDGLVQQYERARLSALDPGPQLQVIDRAVAPKIKSGPRRKLTMLTGMVLGFLSGLFYILAADPVRSFVADVRKPLPAEPR